MFPTNIVELKTKNQMEGGKKITPFGERDTETMEKAALLNAQLETLRIHKKKDLFTSQAPPTDRLHNRA